MRLRNGMNPHQTASVAPIDRWPFRVRHGSPSYINLLDALNGWQLVRELRELLGRPAAASFKHVSPAGAAIAYTVAEAYARARDADPQASYGDFVAVSDPVDAALAEWLSHRVSDGIIAPGFDPGTVEVLSRKKKGAYIVLEADPGFMPPAFETREVFGVRLEQQRDTYPLAEALPADAPGRDDLLLGLAVLRYTLSNAVCYVRDGMALGIGAGQQSRVACTRLAGEKAAAWFERHGLSRSGVSFVSDAALPFRDNVDVAAAYGVRYLAEPGGSIRSGEVEQACREHGITLIRTGVRLFHH